MADVASYYQHPRPEVLALVPEGVSRVVDVGCGAGGLGKALKLARPGLEVRGVEIMLEPATLAREALDGVVCGPAEAALPEDWPVPDCLIFADVLEHMVDPWSVLDQWVERLSPGGSVVVSLPNAAHHSALGQLMRGRWRYADEGILDRTHLRFFTRESAVELVDQAGLRILRMERILRYPSRGLIRNLLRLWARRRAGNEPREGLAPGLSRFLLDFCTFQFVIVAEKK